MNQLLWVIQAVLVVLFLWSGVAKSLMSRERMLASGQTGAASMPTGFVRFIAICEIFGAVGLIVPLASGIHPELTVLAAIGLAIIMIGAGIVHYRIHELKPIAVNSLVFLLCLVVAWGRR